MKVHKPHLMNVIIACIVAALFVVLDRIWFNLLDKVIGDKIIASAGVIGIAVGLLYAVISDIADDRKKKDDNYLS